MSSAPQYFKYSEIEKDALTQRDPLLGEVIQKIGHIYRRLLKKSLNAT